MKPRLIDANALLDRLPYPTDYAESEFYGKVLDAIEKQPTAYDIDKVVEQLEEERDRPFADCDLTINGRPANDREIVACKVGIKYAIEIVKGGAE